MKQIFQNSSVSVVARKFFLALALWCAWAGVAQTIRAHESSSQVLCRPEVSLERREELSGKLREITGLSQLGFDAHGALQLGGANNPESNGTNASRAARELVTAATVGENLIVLEDASRRTDVVFCRVVEGRFREQATSEVSAHPPVFIVQIDFTDFEHVRGDRAARAAFNVGWAVLHELVHVVYDLDDAGHEDDVGGCEHLVNQMRREYGLQVERAAYHFNYFPGARTSEFMTRFVRLAFEQRSSSTSERRRLWLIWDAQLVGGLEQTTQASGRVRPQAPPAPTRQR